MDPAHVVLLLAVFIAVAAIAGYLIAIVLILRHVVNRLVTILGAVQATADTSQPAGAIIDDLNKDLGAGRKLIEAAVQRLEESREPVGATSEPADRHAIRSGSAGGDGGTATAAPPPMPGPPPPASTIPSPARPAAPAAPAGTEGDPPPERKRTWWSR